MRIGEVHNISATSPSPYQLSGVPMPLILSLENGEFRLGYKLLEKGYLEAVNKIADANYHCTSALISNYIEIDGFSTFREKIFSFINLLPSVKRIKLNAWIYLANQKLVEKRMLFRLSVKMAKANILIDDLLAEDINSKTDYPFFSGTIHSVKGKTFDAVMLMLGKRAGAHSNYSSMLTKGPQDNEAEELRNVYVGITRPRKILFLAVPNDDVAVWTNKLQGR